MKHLSELATLLIALMFLAVLTCWPLMAFAAPLKKEPKNVTQFRADFLAGMVKKGHDARACSLTYLDSADAGHLVEVQCSHMPIKCLLVIDPTEAVGVPLACAENPEYTPSTKI